MARRRGASEALLAALQGQGPEDPIKTLEAGWRAALAYADAIHAHGDETPEHVYAPLARAWDEGQIVEITLVIGMTEYFNRFNNALCVEPTK